MNHMICIMTSVFISTLIMFYVLKVVVKKIIEIIKQTGDIGTEYTEDMCQISINGILDILKRRGILDKEVCTIDIRKNK